MEVLLSKIKKQMSIQTKEITESVTKSVMERMDEKLAVVLEENKELKTKVGMMQTKINFLEDEKRRNNLIFFGVNETEQGGSIIEFVKTLIEKETKVTIQPHEINKAHRLGVRGKESRPLLVSFTTIWKRNMILRNKNNLSGGINIKEDFSKEVLEKRKELIPQLLQEREKGKIAYIKKDKLIIRDSKEDNNVKRKRDQVESPESSPNQATTSAPKKINKTNMFNYITRGRTTSLSESKNY